MKTVYKKLFTTRMLPEKPKSDIKFIVGDTMQMIGSDEALNAVLRELLNLICEREHNKLKPSNILIERSEN